MLVQQKQEYEAKLHQLDVLKHQRKVVGESKRNANKLLEFVFVLFFAGI